MAAHLLDNRQLGAGFMPAQLLDIARCALGFMAAHLLDNRQLSRRMNASSSA